MLAKSGKHLLASVGSGFCTLSLLLLGQSRGHSHTRQMSNSVLSTRRQMADSLHLAVQRSKQKNPWCLCAGSRFLSNMYRWLQIVVYHGGKRATSKEELENADVVLTTYSIAEGEFRRHNQPDKCTCTYCGKKFYPDRLKVHLRCAKCAAIRAC